MFKQLSAQGRALLGEASNPLAVYQSRIAAISDALGTIKGHVRSGDFGQVSAGWSVVAGMIGQVADAYGADDVKRAATAYKTAAVRLMGATFDSVDTDTVRGAVDSAMKTAKSYRTAGDVDGVWEALHALALQMTVAMYALGQPEVRQLGMMLQTAIGDFREAPPA